MLHLCKPLLLASASPRRIAFFHDLGLAVATLAPPPGAEPCPLPGEAPEAYAMRAAAAKAEGTLALLRATEDAAAALAGGYVLAADTAVVLDGRILGKPRGAADACSMLRALAGREHSVITGCVFTPTDGAPPPEKGTQAARPGAAPSAAGIKTRFAVTSTVRMWDCPAELLEAYANCGEPLDKAGAYAIQGRGAFLVESINGSWSNVVGLPLAEVVRTLLALRVASCRRTHSLLKNMP